MHIRVKVPQELHRDLKAEAARKGMTLEKFVVDRLIGDWTERLSQERGVMSNGVDPGTKSRDRTKRDSVTGEHRAVETSAIAGCPKCGNAKVRPIGRVDRKWTCVCGEVYADAPSGNETAAASTPIIPNWPMVLNAKVAQNERLARIAEGWNMDSRDCTECGKESGKLHTLKCEAGLRLAIAAREKMK